MELNIGLEIHLKIKSKNKLFCQCKNEQNFDTLLPNSNICPTCTGQPGALPSLSFEPVLKSILLGRLLNCKINKKSTFDRKSYFYTDLPMGYQITQLYHPTNTDGKITFFVDNEYNLEKTVGIRDAHIECDTAKMIHNQGESLIDFNRSGTPLVEIVTEPDFTSALEVSEFIKELQRRVKYNNISDANMDKGQMRIDVNISVREDKSKPYGTRVELKNINSTGMVRRAIQNEYERQKELIKNGKQVEQETRNWDDSQTCSFTMRSKENELDYRYFPEPDLPELQIDQDILNQVDKFELEIPYEIIKKFKSKYGFHKEYINALISEKESLDYFYYILENSNFDDEKILANTIAKRVSGPINSYLKEQYKNINQLPFDKDKFIKFIDIATKKEIMDNQLKIIMQEMLETGYTPVEIIKSKGFDKPAISGNEIEKIVSEIIKNNTSVVEQYKKGKTSTIGFFVGQAMKTTKGKANPNKLKEIFEKKLNCSQ